VRTRDYSKKVTTLKEKLIAEEIWIFLTDTQHSLAEAYKAILLRFENVSPIFILYIAAAKNYFNCGLFFLSLILNTLPNNLIFSL
jgi:hypothetical protein